ncbi:MAG: hypothetical protein JSV09_00075 [Thermoplasmata archaeon]|nr:MAG: hypothetical protein JSV09_00075 [Thermoplasmata archaeon]
MSGEESTIAKSYSLNEVRSLTLNKIMEIREELVTMTSEQLNDCIYHSTYYKRDFPIWNIINGPLCDALTHVGQLASWRRLNGNPILGANVFLGRPPQ